MVVMLLECVSSNSKNIRDNVTFMNNDKAQEFVITVWRGESNQVGNQVEQKSNEVEEKSNQVEDHNTGLRHSDTDHDTRLRHSDTPKVS